MMSQRSSSRHIVKEQSDPSDQKSVHSPNELICSHWLYFWNNGGAERDRTADPLRARQVLSQLSYSPIGYHLKACEQALRISLGKASEGAA